MGEQENCLGSTPGRPSKKRPMMTAATTTTTNIESLQGRQQLSVTTKKRVVLGELTNIPKIVELSSIPKPVHPKPKSSTSREKEEVVKSDAHVDRCPDVSRKYADAPLIYQHLRSLEVEGNRRPLHNYMEKVQKDITPTMREILVDWLVEVVDEYKLVSDTLYLTVNYIDRFLSSHALSRTKLQLLGVSSMLVAAKFEEITPPHIEDCCYITDNTYTREEVVAMESNILMFLNFNTSNPTAKSFLRTFTKAAQEISTFSNLQFEFLACYLAELSLLDYICVRFLPSMIAASAIFLARFTMLPSIHPWSLALQRYTGYKASDLKECILAINDLQLNRRPTSAQALREKYMQNKFKRVAALCPPSEIPSHYFEVVTGKHSSEAQEAPL
ncbi:putative cyclin-A3-1 [Coffea arabica]|uniref:Cyclin-A3-1 n=1 Tax=Coffea arabica TaxID=13443 RepID=A0A6P6VSN2_COFAR|nr:putative cyclin-A3-1 isoform X2 [Coffea arabica]